MCGFKSEKIIFVHKALSSVLRQRAVHFCVICSLQLDYLADFLHRAKYIIHIAYSANFKIIFYSVEVEACSANEDLCSLLNEGVEVLNDLWLVSSRQIDAFIHEERV